MTHFIAVWSQTRNISKVCLYIVTFSHLCIKCEQEDVQRLNESNCLPGEKEVSEEQTQEGEYMLCALLYFGFYKYMNVLPTEKNKWNC